MHKYLTIPAILALSLLPASVLAAGIVVEAPTTASLEAPFRASVYLESESGDINVLGGELRFPANLELAAVNDGNSRVNFWIEAPHASGSSVVFSGMTPGGLPRGKSLLFTASFLAHTTGTAELAVENAELFRNDGEGTLLTVPRSAAEVNIIEAGESRLAVPADTTPPEPFTPVVSKAPYVFDGRYFVSFAAQDKQSGISGYFVAESRYRFGSRNWELAVSPRLLADQDLKSYIFIKAVDRAGNERLAVISPQMASGGVPALWSILILAALAGAGYIFRSKLRK